MMGDGNVFPSYAMTAGKEKSVPATLVSAVETPPPPLIQPQGLVLAVPSAWMLIFKMFPGSFSSSYELHLNNYLSGGILYCESSHTPP